MGKEILFPSVYHALDESFHASETASRRTSKCRKLEKSLESEGIINLR